MESGEARGQELLERAETVHFLGIGGIGISGVARLLHQRGRHVVRGSDIRRSSITDALQREGIEVVIGHDPQHVLGADVVVVSTAIPDHNVELRAAREQGTEIVHRSVLLDALSRGAAHHRRHRHPRQGHGVLDDRLDPGVRWLAPGLRHRRHASQLFHQRPRRRGVDDLGGRRERRHPQKLRVRLRRLQLPGGRSSQLLRWAR